MWIRVTVWLFVLAIKLSDAQNCTQQPIIQCDNMSACYYNTAIATCTPVPVQCAQRADYDLCVKGASCAWVQGYCVNRTRSSTDLACFSQYLGAELMVACQNDTLCEYDTNTRRCVEDRDTACANTDTIAPQSCLATTGCEWSIELSACRASTRSGYGQCWPYDSDPVTCSSLALSWQCAYNTATGECNPRAKRLAPIWTFYCSTALEDDPNACANKTGCYYLNTTSINVLHTCVPNSTQHTCAMQYDLASCQDYSPWCIYNQTCAAQLGDWRTILPAIIAIPFDWSEFHERDRIMHARHATIMGIGSFTLFLLTMVLLIACLYRLSDATVSRDVPHPTHSRLKIR